MSNKVIDKLIQDALASNGELDLSNRKLTALPEIPEGIVKLNCSNNSIEEISGLPNTLTYLDCSHQMKSVKSTYRKGYEEAHALQSIQSLADLPLETLICSDNRLHELPPLPETLKVLVCTNSRTFSLGRLPVLPHALEVLDVQLNNIRDIPEPLPPRLRVLNMEANDVKEIPNIPESLVDINLKRNPLLKAYGNLIHFYNQEVRFGDQVTPNPEAHRKFRAELAALNHLKTNMQAIPEMESVAASDVGKVLSQKLPPGMYSVGITPFLYSSKGYREDDRQNAQALLDKKASVAKQTTGLLIQGTQPKHLKEFRNWHKGSRSTRKVKPLTHKAAVLSAALMKFPSPVRSSSTRKSSSPLPPPNDGSYIGNTVNAPDPSPPKYTTRSGRVSRKTKGGGRRRFVSRRR